MWTFDNYFRPVIPFLCHHLLIVFYKTKTKIKQWDLPFDFVGAQKLPGFRFQQETAIPFLVGLFQADGLGVRSSFTVSDFFFFTSSVRKSSIT